MSGLRKHVATAICRDQEQGGAGILTDEEIAAVEWAMMAAARAHVDGVDGADRHRDELAVLLTQLGKRRLLIHGAEDRVDAYFLHCADVAIDAYDEWLGERGAGKDKPR